MDTCNLVYALRSINSFIIELNIEDIVGRGKRKLFESVGGAQN